MIKKLVVSCLLVLASSTVFADLDPGIGSGGSGGDCKKVAKQVLKEVGVTDAIYITVDKVGQGDSADRFFWFTTPACQELGYVNVVTDGNCYVKNIVTRYKCHIPGIKHTNW